MDRFLKLAEADGFSYPDVGATLSGTIPATYNVDHNRTQLGHGLVTFERACAAIDHWAMFELGWVELFHPPASIAVGQTVVILAHAWGLYSLSGSRVLQMIDERDGLNRRWGFAYGTLDHHIERGEERFTIEHRAEDDSVWYDILAFSVPRHPLARLAYPASRAAQRRFARDSKLAMLRAVR